MPMTDEWSGFADLLANLIEKYAAELGIDDMPSPSVAIDNIESNRRIEKDSDFAKAVVEGKTAA